METVVTYQGPVIVETKRFPSKAKVEYLIDGDAWSILTDDEELIVPAEHLRSISFVKEKGFSPTDNRYLQSSYVSDPGRGA